MTGTDGGTVARMACALLAGVAITLALGSWVVPLSAAAEPIPAQRPGVAVPADLASVEAAATMPDVTTTASPAPTAPASDTPSPPATPLASASADDNPPASATASPTATGDQASVPTSSLPASSASSSPPPPSPEPQRTPTDLPALTWVPASARTPAARTSDPDAAGTVSPVTVRVGCQAVTFANSSPRRAVEVAWGRFGRRTPDGTTTLRPAAVVRVPIRAARLDWAAAAAGSDAEHRLGRAGREDGLAVPQHCRSTAPAATVVAVASCAARNARLSLLFARSPAAQDLRWQVRTAGSPLVLADGVATGPRSSVDLRSAGAGRYAVALSAGRRVVDRSEVVVLDCLTATADCRAVTLTNPPSNPVVEVVYRTGRAVARGVVLRPGEALRVTPGAGLRWSATSRDGPQVSDAGSQPRVPLPDGCPVAAPGTDRRGGKSNTAVVLAPATASAAGSAVSLTPSVVQNPAGSPSRWPLALAALVLAGAVAAAAARLSARPARGTRRRRR